MNCSSKGSGPSCPRTVSGSDVSQARPNFRGSSKANLRPDSKLGGHFVSGHVDDTGRIKSKIRVGDAFKVEIEVPGRILHFLVEKGSVAVDGISLTVVDILKNGFTIVIIPHTAQLTTIGFKGPGATVNIEVDIIGKYVAKFLNKGMDRDAGFMKTLAEEGFIK